MPLLLTKINSHLFVNDSLTPPLSQKNPLWSALNRLTRSVSFHFCRHTLPRSQLPPSAHTYMLLYSPDFLTAAKDDAQSAVCRGMHAHFGKNHINNNFAQSVSSLRKLSCILHVLHFYLQNVPILGSQLPYFDNILCALKCQTASP